MILKCETCGTVKTHPKETCQGCGDGRPASPWATEDHAYLPASALLNHATHDEIADRLHVAKRTIQRWGTLKRLWTVDQACAAAQLVGVNPFTVWPELETNVAAPDAEWHTRRNCRDVPTDVFFPTRLVPRGRPSESKGRFDPYAEARKVCNGCPVRNACLWAQMRYEPARGRHGMFGGLTPEERSNLARLFNWRPRAQIA